MKKPTPRTTEITKSKKIKGLFYEVLRTSKKKKLDSDDLIVAFHYMGVQFDLFEFVRLKPEFEIDFKEVEGEGFMGRIVGIEPESEKGDQKLVVRVDDCESNEEGIFKVTEIEKE